MDRVTVFALGLAALAGACAQRSSRTTAPAQTHTVHRYTFPIGLANDTEVCVEAFRPQIAIGCITLSRLRSMAFDLEAN